MAQQQPLQNQSYDHPQQTNVYVVYGIPIREEATADLTRKVINLSFAIVAFSMAAWIVSIVSLSATTESDHKHHENHKHRDEEENDGMIGVGAPIITAICIPCCGYYGAKEHKVKWLQCFWICNLLCAINFGASVIINLVILGSGDLNDTGTALSLLFVVLGILAAILHCAGVIYGNQLAKHDYWIQPLTSVPIATSQHYSQPDRTQYVQQTGYPLQPAQPYYQDYQDTQGSNDPSAPQFESDYPGPQKQTV